jgi:hypothetical protein
MRQGRRLGPELAELRVLKGGSIIYSFHFTSGTLNMGTSDRNLLFRDGTNSRPQWSRMGSRYLFYLKNLLNLIQPILNLRLGEKSYKIFYLSVLFPQGIPPFSRYLIFCPCHGRFYAFTCQRRGDVDRFWDDFLVIFKAVILPNGLFDGFRRILDSPPRSGINWFHDEEKGF